VFYKVVVVPVRRVRKSLVNVGNIPSYAYVVSCVVILLAKMSYSLSARFHGNESLPLIYIL
jgi:hypothetical protein